MNVALFGLGSQGKKHHAAYRNAGHAVTHIYDPVTLPGVGLGKGWSVAEIASIASPDSQHASTVLQQLTNYKQVFVEKPMCRTMPELKAIVHHWVSAGRPHLWCNFPLRLDYEAIVLKKALEKGDTDKIYAIDAIYHYGRSRKITEPTEWRTHEENYSCFLGGAIHLMDLMFWLDFDHPQSVTGCGNGIATRGTAFRYQSYQEATFQYPSGLLARVVADFGSSDDHWWSFEIKSTAGRWKATSLSSPRKETQTLIPQFLNAIEKNVDSGIEAQHLFNVHAAAITAEQACREQGRVEIEYV